MRKRRPYTEMERKTQTILALITERARKEPKCQYTSLAHLLNEGFLAECYRRLERDGAGGIDGVSWKAYGENLEENLKDLVGRMKAKKYKPQPSRRTYIPKDEHTKRPLGLPSLEDKIVQKGLATILEAIYEADFLDSSYGFRPNRSCHQALDVIDKTIMTKPINHIVEADIKGFFDNVPHYMAYEMFGSADQRPELSAVDTPFFEGGLCGRRSVHGDGQRDTSRREHQSDAFQYISALCAGSVV